MSSSERAVAVDGQVRGQQDPEVILKALRIAAANPPGVRPVNSLMHVPIHGQDICRPLGIRRDLPEGHLVSVADFVKASFNSVPKDASPGSSSLPPIWTGQMGTDPR
jgi:hypothetical protein